MKACVSQKQKEGLGANSDFGGHVAQSDGSLVFSVKCQGTGLGERYFKMFSGFAM